jgi:hypothetical protein
MLCADARGKEGSCGRSLHASGGGCGEGSSRQCEEHSRLALSFKVCLSGGVAYALVVCVRAVQSGRTPLMWASYAGHAEAVQVLLAAGADKDVIDKVGNMSGVIPLLRVFENCVHTGALL